MKKLLSMILVMLLWCNVSYAECIKGDCINGQGTYTYAGGEKYIGLWKDGKMHGQGTITLSDGNKYVGELKDGKMHGQGTATWVSGEFAGNKYVGEFKDDKSHGQGTATWANGDKYVGEFKDDKRNGQGTFTYANGTVDNGIWKNGKLVKRHKIKIQTKARVVQYCLFGSRSTSIISKSRYKRLSSCKFVKKSENPKFYKALVSNLGQAIENGYLINTKKLKKIIKDNISSDKVKVEEEKKKIAEEKRKEEQRIAEKKRKEEEKIAEEKRIAEERRIAEEKKKEEKKQREEQEYRILVKKFGDQCKNNSLGSPEFNKCLNDKKSEEELRVKLEKEYLESLTPEERRAHICSKTFGFKKGSGNFKDCIFKIYATELELAKLEVERQLAEAQLEIAKAHREAAEARVVAAKAQGELQKAQIRATEAQAAASQQQAAASKAQAAATKQQSSMNMLMQGLKMLQPPAQPQSQSFSTTCRWYGGNFICH